MSREDHRPHGHGRRSPIWAREEPGSRRPRHSRDQIAQAALRIADRDGFEAVSMRRIARELGAGAMTLYHYVHTKEDLLALMDDALMGEVLLPAAALPKHWRPALTLIAYRTREVFIRHPWAIQAIQRAFPGPNGMRHFEQSMEAVARTGLPLRDRMEIILIVDDFVFGHVFRLPEVSGTPADLVPEAGSAMRAYVEAMLATGEFPNISAMAEIDASAGADAITDGPTMLARFAAGLGMILDGAAKKYGLNNEDRS